MSEPAGGALVSVHGRKGGKGGSQSAQQPYEAPNTLRSKATAYLMDILSEGPIEGFVDGMKSVFFDDVPLQAADGSYNFQGVNLVLMAGLPDQEAPAAYAAELNSREVPVGLELTKKNGPVTKTILTTPLSRVRITVRMPAMFRQDKTRGDLFGTSVTISVEIKPSGGGWTTVLWEEITGKCTSAYEKAWTFPLHGAGPWEIRVTRQSDDHENDTSVVNKTFWSSYTEILDWKLSYPNTAYIGLAVDAELFGGQVPRRSYEIRGLKVAVPENYDPTTRSYATSGPGTTGGVWNGSLAKIAWTDNPAWVFYDLLTNSRYGLGAEIKPSMVDKWALYEIAKYCDQLVPDGKGGMEPRFTFNGVINTQDDAYAVLQAVAATFRGMVYYGGGTITATQDRPSSPVKLVTNANVLGGAFTYEGTGLRARHTMARVMFSDPTEGHRPDIEPVNGPGMGRRGIVPLEIAGLGVATRTQARRLGRWALDVEQNETQTVSYRGGLDQVDVRPGDIILIADRWWQGARFGGRIAAATTTQVTVDKAILIPAGQTVTLKVTLPNGTPEERELTNGPGEHTVLTPIAAFSQAPNTDAVWLAAMSAVNPRPHRVLAVAEVDRNIYEITALFHDETKYDRIELGINRPPPSFSLFPTGALLPPSEISVEEFQVVTNGVLQCGATVSWKHSPDPRVRSYTVEVKRPLAPNYERIGEAFGNSIDVFDTTDGVAWIRVRAVDALGRVSAWTERKDVVLLGTKWVPEDVATFDVAALGDTLRFSWSPVRQHRSCFYRVKYSPSPANGLWQSSVGLTDRVDGLTLDAPLRDGAYLIKAVSLAGVESANERLVVTTAASIVRFNALVESDEAPDWAGTKVGVQVTNGVLQLSPGQTSGTYTFTTDDLGAPYTVRLGAQVTAAGINAGDYMSQWVSMAEVVALATGDAADWSVTLEYRTTLDDPAEEGWSEWRSFEVADVEARALQIRMTMASLNNGATLPEVQGLKVTLDVPDRVEGENDVSIEAGGTTITFDEAFRATPAIAVTGQSLATGDYWTISGQNETGFTVRFFNAGGTGIAKSADWIAKGYGRRTNWTSRKHGRGLLAAAGALSIDTAGMAHGAFASLAGAGGTVAAVPRAKFAASARLSGGGGVLIATAKTKQAARAALGGAGIMVARHGTKMGSATMAGAGKVTAAAPRAKFGATQKLNGISGLAANPRARVRSRAALAAAGKLSANPSARVRPAVQLGGTGALAAYAAVNPLAWNFMSGTMPAGLTLTRASKAWYWGAPSGGGRPALVEANNNAPVFEYDPTLTYNSVPNPWGDGAAAPAVPDGGWSVSTAGTVSVEFLGRSERDGIPTTQWRVTGTANNNNFPTINITPFSYTDPNRVPAQIGETWRGQAYVEIIREGAGNTRRDIRLAVRGYSDSNALVDNGVFNIPWSQTFADGPVRMSRTMGSASAVTATLMLIISSTTGEVHDYDIEIGFPVLNMGSSFLADAVPVPALAARNGSTPLYGLRGLRLAKPRTQHAKNPRCEGSTPGTPGIAPTGWSYAAQNGLSYETLGTATLDGLSRFGLRFTGTKTGGTEDTILADILPFCRAVPGTYGPVAASAGQPWTASACLGFDTVVPSPAVKARFCLNEYDASGNLLGTQSGPYFTPARIRSSGQDGGLGAARVSRTFVVANAQTASIVPWIQLLNDASSGTYDFTILIAAPQLTNTYFPVQIMLPPAGSPGTFTSAGDLVLTPRSALSYDPARGITASARLALFGGSVFDGYSTRDIIAIPGNATTSAFDLFFSNNGTENRLVGMAWISGQTNQAQVPGQGPQAGVMTVAASWLPNGIARVFRTGAAEVQTSVPALPPAAQLTNSSIVIGNRSVLAINDRQLDGWLQEVVIHPVGYPAGVIDKLPG